ncbi:MAG: tRNA dihydrouridine synthase DusB [Methyloligellaceae bacterium]
MNTENSHSKNGIKPLKIGSIEIRNPVILAPMSGVTDKPFRQVAYDFGAGMVVTEMVASEQLLMERPDVLLRTENSDVDPFVIQLAGREAHWMGEGARMAEALGADIIDINMGCPAKQVTRGLSGSALMRDLDHALTLVEATVNSVNVPVTLKMRLGWDDETINAPELAKRAQDAGVRMVTVHGRTRCQFYNGTANWDLISKVKEAVAIPVIANGDVTTLSDVSKMLKASRADGVMIGRGAYGAPWFPGRVAHYLETGEDRGDPSLDKKRKAIIKHYNETIELYGEHMGVRTARKHLGWYLEKLIAEPAEQKKWRSRICREEKPEKVLAYLEDCFEEKYEEAA